MIYNQGPSWSWSCGSWIYNLPMQSVPIPTKVVSSNPGRLFFPGTPVSSTNKTDRHDIAEILLKVALNIKTLAFILTCTYKQHYICNKDVNAFRY